MSGVTREQVAAAVAALTARGERATIRAVRAELGTGSLSTIQQHMAEIRPAAGAAELSNDVLRALAQEVQRVAAEAVAELRASLTTAELDRAALAVEVDRITQQLADVAAARDVAERELAVTRATLAGVQARLDDAHGVLARTTRPVAKKAAATKKAA